MSSPWDRGPRPPRDPSRKGPPRRDNGGRPTHRQDASLPPRQTDAVRPPRRDDPAGPPPTADAPRRSGRGPASAPGPRPDAAEAIGGSAPPRRPSQPVRQALPEQRPGQAGPAPHPARRDEVRLYGMNAVQAVFARRPEAIRKLYLLQTRVHALRPLLAWCVQHRIGYRVVEPDDLDRLAASTHHEGVVADVLRVEPQPLAAWLASLAPGAPALGLWLDGVGNPHNFGAILRSAAHFGAAVLLPANSTLALSGAAARVAEGGAEAVPLVRLPVAETALSQLHAAGFSSAATVVSGGADLFAMAPDARLVYVMGAEGEGMDAGLARACRHRLSIPGTGAVESLNVAAATAVFLAHWAAGRR